jgi:hypothetical protein
LKPPPAETAPKFVKPTPPPVVRTAPPSRAPEKPQEKKACGKPGEPACPK